MLVKRTPCGRNTVNRGLEVKTYILLTSILPHRNGGKQIGVFLLFHCA